MASDTPTVFFQTLGGRSQGMTRELEYRFEGLPVGLEPGGNNCHRSRPDQLAFATTLSA